MRYNADPIGLNAPGEHFTHLYKDKANHTAAVQIGLWWSLIRTAGCVNMVDLTESLCE